MTGLIRWMLLLTLLLVPARTAWSQASEPVGYGRNPVLPAPDTTHREARFPRVIDWPAGVRPVAPPGFEVSLYAAGLHNPRRLHTLPNGDVLVVESNNPGTVRDWAATPEALQARYASGLRGVSAGRITILRDTTGDGRPDRRGVFVDGLAQPFGVAQAGGDLYIAATDAVLRFQYARDQFVLGRGETVLELPAGGYNNHWTRNLLASRDGERLYVAVGSATNVDVEGIDERDPRRAAILEVNPATGVTRVFAAGLRNPVGMTWAPGTDDMWVAVNERDGMGDDVPPDFVTRVRPGGFYGWPYSYFGPNQDPHHEGRHPELVERTLVPDYATGAHTSTINLLFYDGGSFPARWREGLFIAQRGSWNRSELAGFRVIFLPFENGRPVGPVEDFLTGFIADPKAGTVHGRPIGLAVLPDGSLLVSDDAANVVWRVRWVGEQ